MQRLVKRKQQQQFPQNQHEPMNLAEEQRQLDQVTHQKTNKKKGTMESKQQSHKSQTSRENKNDTNRKSTDGKKVKVLIVGDSNLRNVMEEKLSNDHRDVEIQFKPGVRIEEANKKVGVNDEFDVIIVHAGTNNLQDATPKDLTERLLPRLTKSRKIIQLRVLPSPRY